MNLKKSMVFGIAGLCFTSLMAVNYNTDQKNARGYLGDYNNGHKKDQPTAAREYPFTPSDPAPGWVKKDRFELEADPRLLEETRMRKNRYEDALDGTLNLSILQAPIYKVLKNSDTLYFHPSYMTTILLPENAAITYAQASFPTTVFHYAKRSNMLLVQPKYGFRNGNVVVTYTDGRKNGYLSISARRFAKNTNCEVSQSGNYKCANEYFGTNYTYYRQKPLTIDDKIAIVQQFKTQGVRDFSQTRSIVYGGITYYVNATEDGTFFYQNQRLDFSTSRYNLNARSR